MQLHGIGSPIRNHVFKAALRVERPKKGYRLEPPLLAKRSFCAANSELNVIVRHGIFANTLKRD